MQKNNDKSITIVIPAYNVQKYISECLDSVVRQQCKIIIVNDGSTDQTEEICKCYEEQYENITYVYQENKGLGAARNTGLTYVDTPYVCFLDSDDWQDVRFIQKVLDLLENLDYAPDIIFTLPQCYDVAAHLALDWMDKNIFHSIFDKQNEQENAPINGVTCPDLYLLEVNANRKVYKTQFLHDQKFSFPEGVKWEDIRPHVQLVHEAKHCVGISNTGFVYRTNVYGQITGGTGVGRMDMIPVLQDTIDYVKSGSYSEKEISRIMYMICRYTSWTIDMTNNHYIEQLLKALHIIFESLPCEFVENFFEADYLDSQEKNKHMGLIQCLQNDKYMSLAQYDIRENLYRYWSEYGPSKKQNIILGGIQCIRESGFRYTINLAIKKMLGRVR